MSNRQVEDPPEKDNDSASLDVSKILEQEKEVLQYKLLLEKRRKMLTKNHCEKEEKKKPFNAQDFMNSIKRKPDSPNKERLKDLARRDAEKYMQVVKLFQDMGGDAKAVKKKLLNEETEKGSNKEFPRSILRKLTPEMEAAINALLQIVHDDASDEITKYDNNYPLLRKDFWTLNDKFWLNDPIINCYLKLLMERSKLDNYPSMYCYTSFFFESLSRNPKSRSIRNWSRNEDIFSFDLLCFPLNLDMVHWALCVVDNRDKTVKYYDSMSVSGERVTFCIKNYLIAEMQNKKGITMPTDEYTCIDVKKLPQQQNGSDCGMFTLKYAEYISRDAPLTFSQDFMPYFRRRMVWELQKHKLL